MKVLFIDAFSGISGDMTVGAFLALGVPLERLRQQLLGLSLGGYRITATPRTVNGIVATKFDVIIDEHEHDAGQVHGSGHGLEHGQHLHRTYRDIRALLAAGGLDAPVRATAEAIFAALAKAEGKVHGMAVDDVTFHEVGAVDSIVDIVATAIALHELRIERVYVSPLPLGSGVIRSQHGPIPVPGPATAELLQGFATRPGDGEGEMVTPTGAAIVAALATPGLVPSLRIELTGYGAGQRVLADRPNLLRLVVAEEVVEGTGDELVVLETNIDDLNPEIYEHVMERVLAAGARDVYLTPIHMKKNRPGILLSVLCAESERAAITGIVLSETSAIGLRYYAVRRTVLERRIIEVATRYGNVRVKLADTPDGHGNAAPEYEDCKRLARQHNVPLKLIYQEARNAILHQR